MMLGRDRRTAAAQYQQQQQNDSLGRPVAKERSKYLPQSGKDVRMQRFGPFMSARSHQNQKNIRSDQKQSSQPRKTHSIEPSQPHMISPGGSYAQSIPIQQRFPGSSLGLTGPSAPATGHYPRSPSSEPNGNTSSDTYCSASLASTYESIEHTHEYAPLSRTLSWSSSSTRYHHQEIRELTPIATTASSCRGTSYSFSASSLSPESYDSPRLEKLSDRHYYEQQSHQQQQQMGQGIERRRQRNDAESLGFDGDARVYKRARYEPVHEQVPVDTHHGSISTAASLIPPSKDSNRRLPSLAWCQQRLWAPLSNPISHHSDNDTGGDDVVPFEDASFTTTPSLTTSPTSDEWELNRLVNENSRLKSYILRVYGRCIILYLLVSLCS